MKKLLTIISLLFVLTVTPAIASEKNSNDVNCQDNDDNHGAFVSCVAHLHNGGSSVSSAAHSNIGKRHDEDDRDDRDDEDDDDDGITIGVSPTPLASPTVSPSVSPSPSGSPTVSPTSSVSPSPSVSPSVSPSPVAGTTDNQTIIALISQKFQELVDLLKSLV